MRVESILVLVSGSDPGYEEEPLAFVTRASKNLQFTSSSGVLLLPEDSPHDENPPAGGLVLIPASCVRPWTTPGARWLSSAVDTSPPPLAPGCAICAIGSPSLGAATCVPLATLRVPSASRAFSQLLHGLNHDSTIESTPRWGFAWSIAGPPVTTAEQGAFVVCWAQPLAPPSPSPTNLVTPLTSEPARLGPILRALHACRLASMCNGGHPGSCAACSGGFGCSRGGDTPQPAPGRLVSVMGSPFGCLAPFHFLNSHVNGAIACAFPVPPPSPDTSAPVPTPIASAAGAGSYAPGPGCRCSGSGDCSSSAGEGPGSGPPPALFALDAHVFPGMEGALVTTLQLPLASLAGGVLEAAAAAGPPPQGRGTGTAAATAATSCTASRCGGGAATCATGVSTSSGAAVRSPPSSRPLALLVTPLSRRSDGVQVPLAVSWPEVEAALLTLLERLLWPHAVTCGSGAAATEAANGGDGGGCQQLRLQPVAGTTERRWWSLSRALGGGSDSGGNSRSRSSSGCGEGCGVRAGNVGWNHRCQACGFDQPQQLPRDSSVSLRPCAGPPLPAASGLGCSRHSAYSALTSPAVIAAAASTSSHPSSSSPGLAAELPSWALEAVVLLRCSGSWATGVLVESRSGLLVTTAHLFQRQGGANGAGGGGAVKGGQQDNGRDDGSGSAAWEHVVCWARVPCVRSGHGSGGDERGRRQARGHDSSGGTSHRWLRAKVLYVWKNHLDLAVLQLEVPYSGRWGVAPSPAEAVATAAVAGLGASAPPLAPAAVRVAAHAWGDDGQRSRARSGSSPRAGGAAASLATELAEASGGGLSGSADCRPAASTSGAPLRQYGTYGSGTPVWAVGHSLVGPSAEWPPLVSFGNVARVLRGRSGRPTMVVATTTTHAGGSGGALLDAAGRLVGLVTSNARHAGGATLPNMAFCIAAEELEPVLHWAAERGRMTAGGSDGGSGGLGGGSGDGWDGAASGLRAEVTAPPYQSRATASSLSLPSSSEAESVAPSRWGHSGPSLSSLSALDAHDEDASRIWRLQTPSFGPLHRAASGVAEAGVHGLDGLGPAAAAASTAGGVSWTPADVVRSLRSRL